MSQPDPRYAAPVGEHISVPVRITYLREHKSRHGNSMCLHEVTDDAGRVLFFWARGVPVAELGDVGRVRGKVVRHTVDFGRHLTELGGATFKPSDPAEAARLALDLDKALDSVRWGRASTGVPARMRGRRKEPDAALKRRIAHLDMDDLPEPPPAAPEQRARFSHLNLDEEG